MLTGILVGNVLIRMYACYLRERNSNKMLLG